MQRREKLIFLKFNSVIVIFTANWRDRTALAYAKRQLYIFTLQLTLVMDHRQLNAKRANALTNNTKIQA